MLAAAPTKDRSAAVVSWAKHKIAGVLLASVLPAAFWTAVLAEGGRLWGVSFNATALLTTGGSIAMFLAAVCAPIMLRIEPA